MSYSKKKVATALHDARRKQDSPRYRGLWGLLQWVFFSLGPYEGGTLSAGSQLLNLQWAGTAARRDDGRKGRHGLMACARSDHKGKVRSDAMCIESYPNGKRKQKQDFTGKERPVVQPCATSSQTNILSTAYTGQRQTKEPNGLVSARVLSREVFVLLPVILRCLSSPIVRTTTCLSFGFVSSHADTQRCLPLSSCSFLLYR